MASVLFLENVFMAFGALLSNKMRSLLTMLGIIIGIGSVIAIVTVGNSLTNSISSSMASMGANNITVGLQEKTKEDEVSDDGMVFRGWDKMKQPTEEDYLTDEMLEDLLATYPAEISGVSIILSAGTGSVKVASNTTNVYLSGVNKDQLESEDLEILAGNSLTSKAFEGGKGVALVSDYFVDNLFGGNTKAAIGKQIEVTIGKNFYEYTIAGVYKYEASQYSSSSKKNTVTNMFVPLKNLQRKTHNNKGYQQVTVVVNSGVSPDDFMPKIKKHFDKWYRNNDDFEISTFSMASMVSSFTDMMSTVSLAISVIAGISLLVGGIGVMNIMLVSISERTKEIGTRKALGATNNSIRTQFIVEAMVLCLVGGVIGIVLGLLGGYGGAKLLGYEGSASVTSIIVSLIFSLVIGVFFGYYPANKAAKMNPIDALRYE